MVQGNRTEFCHGYCQEDRPMAVIYDAVGKETAVMCEICEVTCENGTDKVCPIC